MAELAILLPVLLLLIFGMIEMSNAWRTHQIVTNAAREGARQGILRTSQEADIIVRVRQYMVDSGIDPVGAGASIVVQCIDRNGTPSATCGTGDEFRVRIEYPFAFAILARLGNLGTVTIASTSTMRHE